MKIQNKRASHKKRNQAKNCKTKKMTTKIATAIFDDLEDEIYALSSVRFCNLNDLNDLSQSK